MQLHITEITPIRHRRHDPATSVKAAHNADRFAKTHAGRILHALTVYGPLSAHDMHLVGLSVVQCDRRLSEMQRDGLIEVLKDADGEDVVRNGCRVWQITKPA